MALFPLGILSAAGAGGVVASSDYELIETQILGSSQASITFSSLGTYSSTYKHLQIRWAARTVNAADFETMRFRLGSPTLDTGSNYSVHQLYGYNGSVGSGGIASRDSGFAGVATGASQSANVFGAAVVEILDPYSTTKNKTVRTLSGAAGGSGTTADVELMSSAHLSTSSLQTIQLFAVGGNLATGSRFSLYGIKG
jgi:hypothetical protein